MNHSSGFVFYTFVAVSTPQPTLSIILPCYNPNGAWQANIINNINSIRAQKISFELIIVNDGSDNISVDEVKAFFIDYQEVQIHSYPSNMGKGFALREGVRLAKGAIVIYTDIDFPYTQQSFDAILAALKQGSDIAIGIRGPAYFKHLPKARVYISKVLRYLIRTNLRLHIDDTQCGLKGFNQKGKQVFLQTTINRYLFDLEFVFLSERNKLNIHTVEVQLRQGIHLSATRIGVLLQESGNFISMLWRSLF